MSEWQPIETAPRDGAMVLLFVPDGETDDYDEVLGDYRPQAIFVGYWVSEHHWRLAHYSAFSFDPTHWMPLPRPPDAR